MYNHLRNETQANFSLDFFLSGTKSISFLYVAPAVNGGKAIKEGNGDRELAEQAFNFHLAQSNQLH